MTGPTCPAPSTAILRASFMAELSGLHPAYIPPGLAVAGGGIGDAGALLAGSRSPRVSGTVGV
jgi:hypothetical protein